MNSDVIHEAFEKMIAERGIHHKLGISSGDVRNYRYRVKNELPISSDMKLKLLQKSGWRQDDVKYNRADLVSFINFYNTTSKAAREEGPEYVIDKWEKSRGR